MYFSRLLYAREGRAVGSARTGSWPTLLGGRRSGAFPFEIKFRIAPSFTDNSLAAYLPSRVMRSEESAI